MSRSTIEIATEALRAIRDARDYHAEHGVYPQNLESDQCFDDWAADVAETALTEIGEAKS